MNKKGQALVEFVIILPIFIFMVLGIIDIGKVIVMKTEMESELADVLNLYHHHKTYEEILEGLKLQDKDMTLELTNDNNQTITFLVKKDVEIITPGLGIILGNPCQLEAKRVIAYEP